MMLFSLARVQKLQQKNYPGEAPSLPFEQTNSYNHSRPEWSRKISHSKSLLAEFGIEAFDFDKEFYASWKRFGYDPIIEQGVKNDTTEKFNEKIDAAFRKHNHFAFETNFNNSLVLSYVERAKVEGFQTNLIFIGLSSPEQAELRVNIRVLKKGHYIDVKTIHERYFAGLEMLDNHYNKFDLISIYDSHDNYQNALCAFKNEQELILIKQPSFAKHLPRIVLDWKNKA